MLSDKLLSALNEQITKELHSAYVYLGMAAYLEAQNLPGMAKWMRVQAEEELGHAMKIFDFVLERGAQVTLGTVEAVSTEYESPAAAFQAALEHERKITASINALYELAQQENDYPTQVMLQWFIEEQVEEEDNVGRAADMVAKAQGHPPVMLMLDHRLGQREE